MKTYLNWIMIAILIATATTGIGSAALENQNVKINANEVKE